MAQTRFPTKFNPGCEYQTRKGVRVYLLATGAPGVFPLIGYTIQESTSGETVIQPLKWQADGTFGHPKNSKTSGYANEDMDLVLPPRVEYWARHRGRSCMDIFDHEHLPIDVYSVAECVYLVHLDYDDNVTKIERVVHGRI